MERPRPPCLSAPRAPTAGTTPTVAASAIATPRGTIDHALGVPTMRCTASLLLNRYDDSGSVPVHGGILVDGNV
jgi:hypothetical protein